MSCIEPDTNSADEVGFLQSSALHRLMDLAVRVSEDPVGRAWVDPEMHRQMKCAIRAIERTCGLANS